MFYNALARKGKLQDTSEHDMASVVALHNNMNEKTWQIVMEWERINYNNRTTKNEEPCGSKLLKFQGRPSDMSPKAAWKHYILGHPLPYDRHDWLIQRVDGSLQRYVIDYYYDESRARDTPETALPCKEDEQATPSLLVDVRPAVDSFRAIWHRYLVMPYARHVTKTTNFEPLPLTPTPAMKSSVAESVIVWKNIQQQTLARTEDSSNSSSPIPNKMSAKEAEKLTKLFDGMKKECKASQLAVDQCRNDAECTRLSIDL
jgi:cytochrome c heme-lyase